MDINDIKMEERSEAGVEFKLLHPATSETLKNEDGSEMTIRVVGEDSARYKNALRYQQNRIKKGRDLSPAETEKRSIELLASCTLSMNVTKDGQLVENNFESFCHVYDSHKWIREQAAEHALDRKVFFPIA